MTLYANTAPIIQVMNKLEVLTKWQTNAELVRLRTAIADGDNYVLCSLNKEFKYLLHNIAAVYNLPSLSYLNTVDAKTKSDEIVTRYPCKWCIKDGVELGKCGSCGSKRWNCNNFIVITPTQSSMDRFIDQLRDRFGSSHNVSKGLRNDSSPKFRISSEFAEKVKLYIPIIIGKPKDNPIGPFKSEVEIAAEKDHIKTQLKLKMNEIEMRLLSKIDKSDLKECESILNSLIVFY